MNKEFMIGFNKTASAFSTALKGGSMALKSGDDFVKHIAKKRAANKAKSSYLKDIMKSSPKKAPRPKAKAPSTEMSAHGKRNMERLSTRADFQKALRDRALPKGSTKRPKV